MFGKIFSLKSGCVFGAYDAILSNMIRDERGFEKEGLPYIDIYILKEDVVVIDDANNCDFLHVVFGIGSKYVCPWKTQEGKIHRWFFYENEVSIGSLREELKSFNPSIKKDGIIRRLRPNEFKKINNFIKNHEGASDIRERLNVYDFKKIYRG